MSDVSKANLCTGLVSLHFSYKIFQCKLGSSRRRLSSPLSAMTQLPKLEWKAPVASRIAEWFVTLEFSRQFEMSGNNLEIYYSRL